MGMSTVSRWLMAIFAVALLALPAGGYWFYLAQERQLRHEVEANLQAIAQLKVSQITQWRAERMGDASVIVDNSFAVDNVARWMTDPQTDAEQKIFAWFRSLQKHYHYSDILLVDVHGQVRLSLSGPAASLVEDGRRALALAFHHRRAELTDLYRDHAGLPIHIDVVAPLFSGNEGSAPIGAIILQSDARQFLYPLIQDWPTPSRSAETLLVRREGDWALFLNDLRHQSSTALDLRIPLSRLNVPAVMAVLGKEGVAEGEDYRKKRVLSVLRAIPDSSWLMVAKMDKSEALAEWDFRSALILGMILGLLGIIGAVMGMVWQRYLKANYQARLHAEMARQESEERYRTILMSVGDGVMTADAQGRVVLINPVAEALMGWPQEEARGRPVEEVFVILNEQTRLPVENPVSRVLREGVVVGLANHTVLISRGGRESPIADSGAPIHNERGEVTGVVLVFRDQTEERRAQARLLRNHRLLERAQEIAEIGCWEFDLKSGSVWASASARRIYGLEANEWTIEAVKKIPLPEYRPALDRAMDGLIRHGAEYDIQFRLRRPTDGALIDIRSQAEYDREEQTVFGVIQDITERKRAEEKLSRSEERFRLFYERAPIAYQSLDADGRLQEVNPAWLEMMGYRRDEVVNRSFAEFLVAEHVEFFRRWLPVFMTEGEARDVEFEMVRKNGSVVTISADARVGWDEHGAFKQAHCVLHNITNRKRAEEEREDLQAQLLQSQKLESVGRLAGGVAHDLNNLLSPILGYGEILLEDFDPSDERRESVEQMVRAGFRARDLVRQLLAFGRQQALKMETVNLSAVVAGFEKLLRRTIREDIGIETVLSSSISSVRADVGQIEQVIMNLSINAQDAMPEGGKITIETAEVELDGAHVDMRPGATAGRYVMLAVNDIGCGMDAEVKEQIFTPFFTTKEKGKGTGLGLAMVYGIVKQHGGDIWVHSEPGQGTAFRIYLPALDATPSDAAAAHKEPDAVRGDQTVMVVEDNEIVLGMAVKILERQGYTVLCAAGGAECIELLSNYSGPLHLLLTDVVMPGMNGKDLFERVAVRFPGVKVLFMSGYTEDVIADRGVLDDGIDFIQKPFSVQGLATKVREVLESNPPPAGRGA